MVVVPLPSRPTRRTQGRSPSLPADLPVQALMAEPMGDGRKGGGGGGGECGDEGTNGLVRGRRERKGGRGKGRGKKKEGRDEDVVVVVVVVVVVDMSCVVRVRCGRARQEPDVDGTEGMGCTSTVCSRVWVEEINLVLRRHSRFKFFFLFFSGRRLVLLFEKKKKTLLIYFQPVSK